MLHDVNGTSFMVIELSSIVCPAVSVDVQGAVRLTVGPLLTHLR